MKLSPCKHCGSPAHLTKSVTDPHLCWSVQCSNLDCGISTRSFSQQDMAVAVWQRTAYGHRNGETDFPSTPGTYWFRGNRCHDKALEQATYDAGSLLEISDDLQSVNPHNGEWVNGDCIAMYGAWWGPIVAPWEQSE